MEISLSSHNHAVYILLFFCHNRTHKEKWKIPVVPHKISENISEYLWTKGLLNIYIFKILSFWSVSAFCMFFVWECSLSFVNHNVCFGYLEWMHYRHFFFNRSMLFANLCTATTIHQVWILFFELVTRISK